MRMLVLTVVLTGCARDPNDCWWCDRDTTPPVAPSEFGDEPGTFWEGEVVIENGEPIEANLYHADVAADGSVLCAVWVGMMDASTTTDCANCDLAFTASIEEQEFETDVDCASARAALDALGNTVGMGLAEETGFVRLSGTWTEVGEAWFEEDDEPGIELFGFWTEGDLAP